MHHRCAVAARDGGAGGADRRGEDADTPSLIALAVLAGAFIAFGSMFSVVVMAGADGNLPYGVKRLLGGTVFSLGLILVIVGGAELFTGNYLMVMACASGRIRVSELLRAWALVYAGNFVGAIAIAFLAFLSAGYDHGKGSVGLTALASANGNASLSGLQAHVHGVLANVLVCSPGSATAHARRPTRFWRSSFPIAAFSAAGFEHSISNMYLLTFALLTKFWAATTFWARLGRSHPGSRT